MTVISDDAEYGSLVCGYRCDAATIGPARGRALQRDEDAEGSACNASMTVLDRLRIAVVFGIGRES